MIKGFILLYTNPKKFILKQIKWVNEITFKGIGFGVIGSTFIIGPINSEEIGIGYSIIGSTFIIG
jgi:hypothetical protein